jgi:hypothetical protein
MSIHRTIGLVLAFGMTSAGVAGGAGAVDSKIVHIFDAPGAGSTPGSQQGTIGVGINELGIIAGSTRDENSVRHGFLRFPDGKYVQFDHPLAGNDGSTQQGTRVAGLNDLGIVVGSVRTASGLDIPYVREPDGTFRNVDFPTFEGGDGNAINLWGVMVGNLVVSTDNNSPAFLHFHGFILEPNGALTLFDPPGSQVTEIPTGSINIFGAITGDYWTCNADLSSCAVHGFVRSPEGKYTAFDVPGASTDGIDGGGTYPQGINDLGEVSGFYVDTNFVYHGFVRSPEGRISTFDVRTTCTDTTSPPDDCAYQGTYTGNINVAGKIVGTYYGEDGNPHGFWRDPDGSITRFDYPGANFFTIPAFINDWGQITGQVYDPNIVVHGLLVTP